MQNTWSPRTKRNKSKSKLKKEDPTPSSMHSETIVHKVLPEESYPNLNDQKVQSMQKEDYKSMSTDEILRAIDLVLNSQFI